MDPCGLAGLNHCILQDGEFISLFTYLFIISYTFYNILVLTCKLIFIFLTYLFYNFNYGTTGIRNRDNEDLEHVGLEHVGLEHVSLEHVSLEHVSIKKAAVDKIVEMFQSPI